MKLLTARLEGSEHATLRQQARKKGVDVKQRRRRGKKKRSRGGRRRNARRSIGQKMSNRFVRVQGPLHEDATTAENFLQQGGREDMQLRQKKSTKKNKEQKGKKDEIRKRTGEENPLSSDSAECVLGCLRLQVCTVDREEAGVEGVDCRRVEEYVGESRHRASTGPAFLPQLSFHEISLLGKETGQTFDRLLAPSKERQVLQAPLLSLHLSSTHVHTRAYVTGIQRHRLGCIHTQARLGLNRHTYVHWHTRIDVHGQACMHRQASTDRDTQVQQCPLFCQRVLCRVEIGLSCPLDWERHGTGYVRVSVRPLSLCCLVD